MELLKILFVACQTSSKVGELVVTVLLWFRYCRYLDLYIWGFVVSINMLTYMLEMLAIIV